MNIGVIDQQGHFVDQLRRYSLVNSHRTQSVLIGPLNLMILRRFHVDLASFGVTFPMVKNASPEGDKTLVGQFLSAHSACATGVKITQGMVPHAGIPKYRLKHVSKFIFGEQNSF